MMDRAELIRDLKWALIKAEEVAHSTGGTPAPDFGPAMLSGEVSARMIRAGATIGVSRRYLEAIIAELENL
jgi:hypothetical protein